MTDTNINESTAPESPVLVCKAMKSADQNSPRGERSMLCR